MYFGAVFLKKNMKNEAALQICYYFWEEERERSTEKRIMVMWVLELIGSAFFLTGFLFVCYE